MFGSNLDIGSGSLKFDKKRKVAIPHSKFRIRNYFCEMNRLLSKSLFLASLYIMLNSCVGIPDEKERTVGLKDLDHAIYMLEDRRDAEIQIITEQGEQIEQLEQNVEMANTEGMKAKIRRDIEMKRVTIDKARVNLANQDSILLVLKFQRDSLSQALEN